MYCLSLKRFKKELLSLGYVEMLLNFSHLLVKRLLKNICRWSIPLWNSHFQSIVHVEIQACLTVCLKVKEDIHHHITKGKWVTNTISCWAHYQHFKTFDHHTQFENVLFLLFNWIIVFLHRFQRGERFSAEQLSIT